MAYKVGDGCVMCGACEGACPVGAISMGDTSAVIDPSVCIDCGTCAGTCPMGIIDQD